jgi:putative peptidoglycan lipid II flippase
VKLLFQRGAFDAYSTSATAGAWIAYSVGLPVQAIGILTARMYNALQENKTLMYVSAVGIVLNITFNIVFMKIWGHVGIAASTSAVYGVTTIILLTILRKKIGRLHDFKPA